MKNRWVEVFNCLIGFIIFLGLLFYFRLNNPEVRAQDNYATCQVNLECDHCTYRIIRKQDGSMVCRLVKCRKCRVPVEEIIPSSTPYPTETETPYWTAIPSPTWTIEPIPYPYTTPEPYPSH